MRPADEFDGGVTASANMTRPLGVARQQSAANARMIHPAPTPIIHGSQSMKSRSDDADSGTILRGVYNGLLAMIRPSLEYDAAGRTGESAIERPADVVAIPATPTACTSVRPLESKACAIVPLCVVATIASASAPTTGCVSQFTTTLV